MIKCQALETAFVNGVFIKEDEIFMLDEKYLELNKEGKRTLTPRWCIPLEAKKEAPIKEVTVPEHTKEQTKAIEKKHRDIFF